MTGQHADHDQTWRRFTSVTAGAVGAAVVIGLALSYASLYRVAYNAGYDNPWLTWGDMSVRPAHLFPLTLDLPILVGYAGRIALAGRRSAVWATGVLVACSVGTVAAQVVDGADWVAEHKTVQAVIHGWPPLSVFLTLHLLVMILQALGYLVPPVREAVRPSWPARVWAWTRRLRADIETAPAVATPGAWVDTTPDMPGDAGSAVSGDSSDTGTGRTPDAGLDAGRDMRGGDRAATSGLSPAPGGAAADSDTGHDGPLSGDSGGVVTPLRARRRPVSRDTAPDSAGGVSPDGGDTAAAVSGDTGPDTEAGILARVRSGDMTQADAATALGVHPRTVSRRLRAGKKAAR